ncbi:MAG: capsid protein, partial [Acidimicrobiia bacterium]|nr:capsid protein [Acidimicrobiia bacterium]
MGGVYLRTVWDTQVADHPMLDVVHADRAVPEFRWGRLVAVTFWRTLTADRAAAVVWRHLERHEPGVIFHGLFEGSPER